MTRPTISLQAAIGPGAAVTNQFIIGTSLIGGTDVIAGREIIGQGSWQEIADRCSQVSTRRGRQRQLEQFAAGTIAATLDNTDGALDPSWTAGPYTDGGVSRIAPMAGINLEATWAGTTYQLWYGYADSWQPQPEYPEGAQVTLSATDAFKIFTRIDMPESSPVGAGDTTGARLNRMLELIDWSVLLRDIDTGNHTHQATTMATPIGSQLRLAADSERGQLWISAAGKVTFRGRLWRFVNPQSITVQWLIGDRAGEFNPSDFDVSNDDEIVVNDVYAARIGGTVISRRDPTVAAYPYLWSSYSRTDLTLADDAQVAVYADEVLRVASGQRLRVNSVEFEPDGYDELWPFVLGAGFGDRVHVNLTHPYTGIVFSGDYFIEGIDHNIPVTADGKWSTRFHLSDASKYPTHPFIIGTSLIGGADVIV